MNSRKVRIHGPATLNVAYLHTPSEIPSGFSDPLLPALATGAAQPTAHISEKLRQLARRLLPFTEGSFEPSPPPCLLDNLTDELLVVAADAVDAVCATATARPSGKAQYRLLAWVVADARGAAVPMEKPLAETIGKRLDRQARKVRGDLARAVTAAQVDRDRVHARARVVRPYGDAAGAAGVHRPTGASCTRAPRPGDLCGLP